MAALWGEADLIRREADIAAGRFAEAGLSFCLRPRSHSRMDPDLENVIRQALTDAKAAGRDHLSQTELAVRTVLQVRPDMTASDALVAVNLVRQS